jgi:hypothetical protein
VRQPSLLADVARDEKPWKRTTTTSKTALRVVEHDGEAERKRYVCSRGLRAIFNKTQQWPTADELAAYLYERGEIRSAHRDEVAPRLNELCDGWWIVRVVDGKKTRVQVGGGEVERGAKRASHRTGRTVLTWRVREIGSLPAKASA